MNSFIRLIVFFCLLIFNFNLKSEILALENDSCRIPFTKNIFDGGKISYKLDFNNRKYVKNALASFLKLDSHTSKKKWLKANFIVSKDGIICSYKSKIRVTGDLEDHYDFMNSPDKFRTSLFVKLLNDNINGITAFKIFIPESRKDNNELISTLLFSKLNFLSPRTYKIDVSLNGNISKFIFQEDISKEFLEYNNRTEAPILEGDERFGLTKSFSLARISNYDWINANNSKLQISIDAISKLNNAYFLTSILGETDQGALAKPFNGDLPVHIESLPVNKEDQSGLRKIQSFYALSFALKATHGLSKDDSRYYYNPVYGRIEPIYYDGVARILSDFKPTEISQYVYDGLSNIKNKIDLLNIENLYKDFVDIGGDINLEEFLNLFLAIDKNIQYLLSQPIADREIKISDKNKDITKSISVFIDNANDIDLINFNGFDSPNYLIDKCNLSNNKCIKESLSLENIKLAIGQRLINEKSKQPMLFYGLSDTSNYKNQNDIFTFQSKKLDNDSKIFYSSDIKLEINRELKTINAISSKRMSPLIFIGGTLENWNIKYDLKNISNKDNVEIPSISKYGLTGCVSFHDIKTKNIKVNVKNSYCEDGIHFLRATGTIDKIFVNDALSDGIDIDFSSLEIKEIRINRSGNDCIDLSNGVYLIENAELNGCGDKGVSLGENGDAKILNILVNNSIIGLASKDSSNMTVDYAEVNVSDYCTALYRKKQEYNGAEIFIKDINCDLDKHFIQDGSKLSISN